MRMTNKKYVGRGGSGTRKEKEMRFDAEMYTSCKQCQVRRRRESNIEMNVTLSPTTQQY